VLADEALDGVGAETLSRPSRERWLVPATCSFAHPDAENCLGRCGQRNGAMPAAFALTLDTRTGAEGDVTTVQARELRDAKPGLCGLQQQCSVASAFPSLRNPGAGAGRRCP
jgi:hypothetical protein